MRFVYATRPRPSLEFTAVEQLDAIPDDAKVFAVCDGALTIRQHDQELCTLSEHEQSTLAGLITESQNAEAAGTQGTLKVEHGLLFRIWQRLSNI